VSFWALGEIVKAQAGIHENDDARTTAAKLSSTVDDLVPDAERGWVISSLETLVGLAPEDVGLSDRRSELFTGWRIFLERLADRRPLVVVIDDLQWADDGLLDFVDGLVELVEGVPLLVVCCARPELLERRPTWGGGKRNALTVSLGPLSTTETERLVESLLGRDPADGRLRETVVERAAGNPLYAEELVRMQASGGELSALPDSVLGIVTARVDLLPPVEKELLRDAAVMGGVVWSDGLGSVSEHDPDTVEQLLRSLSRKEFLRRERQSAVAGATQHAFVHALVRDAVYGQLARPDRVDRYVRVARWIESLPDDRREDRAELLAHHYLEALELARASGIDVAELEPRAAAALQDAGLKAFSIGAFPAAARALRAAAELLPGGLDARALRALGKALQFTEQAGDAELLAAYDLSVAEGSPVDSAILATDLAHVHWQHGDGPGSTTWATRALELVTGAGPSPAHAHVLAQVARFDMLSGRHEESLAVADRAIELAERVGAHGPRASALITRATANANGGSYARLREDFAEAHALAQEHEVSELSRAQINLSSILLDLGELSDALAVARDGLAYAERTGTAGGSAGFVRGNLSEALFLSGGWEESEAIARAELERATRTGGLYYEPWFRFVLAELALVRDGRHDEAADSAREQVEQARTRADDQSFLPIVGVAIWTLTRVGDEEGARALLDELLERRRANPLGVMPGYWFVYVALALAVLGRSGALADLDEPPGSAWLEAARAIDGGRFDEAADLLRRVGAPQLEAETLVLSSRARLEAADADGAASRLARARELLGALGATARLREVEPAPR
jgi:hypothetical protein